ncbi:uncharacterized protein LOC109792360 [Cajanus cajan]|uniref:uncharacterized protein LOC109792360 n=1 Tax=Cajanus cajan TaxID=3821 RepID=UPI00098DA079|nr:uncharacterized protein LOC109792360 [Cajanus cajan]
MFDALWKPKFYTKCKSRLKLIKTRLEMIRKKRNAVQKFLKQDIVDLLCNDLHYNAYGRAEGLLVEQNMSSCYEFIAKFTNCVLGYIGDLCKQRDIPDECKQAIQSLIYAAARFSDLPELRELRKLFTEKFGKNNLEPYISREFVEKLRKIPPSKQMKIQLLHNLAEEFSIAWDSKVLEETLSIPSQLYEEKVKLDLPNDHDGVKWHMNNDVAVPKIEMFAGGKHRDGTSCHTYNRNESTIDISDAYWRLQSSTDDETTTDSSSLDGDKVDSSSSGNVSEDDAENILEIQTKLEEKGYSKDDEEKIMDVLLMYYSKKQSPHESSIGKDKSSIETLRVHGRATSLVPEMLRTARHVHPNLPDYDDLWARFAALRKTSQLAV